MASSGPAGAVLVEIEDLIGTHTVGDLIVFYVNATIGGNERIPISNITVEGLPDISGSPSGTLLFNVSDIGNVTENITKGNYKIELVTKYGWTGGTGGDGYVYNNDTAPYIGYGYGYSFEGYGYGYDNSSASESEYTNLKYKITMTTTGATASAYSNIRVSINTGENVSFVSQNASFTLEATPTPTPTSTPTPPAGGSGGSGGGGGPSSGSNVPTDRYGRLKSTTTLKSTDGSSEITLVEGTQALDANGNALKSITINKASTIGGTIGVYNIGPSGATFQPEITLSFAFNPDDVPEGEIVVIKFFDGVKWVELETTVDLVTNTATAKVNHFTMFGLFTDPVPVKTTHLSRPVKQPSFNYDDEGPTVEPKIVTPTPEPANIGLIITLIVTVVVIAIGVYYFTRSEL